MQGKPVPDSSLATTGHPTFSLSPADGKPPVRAKANTRFPLRRSYVEEVLNFAKAL